MKYLFFIILLISSISVFGQKPEAAPDWDTSYINTIIDTDTTYFIVTDAKWFDDNGGLVYRDLNEEAVGNDSTAVYDYLIAKVEDRVKYEARAIKRAYEFRNLGSEADLLNDFSGLPYWAHITQQYSTSFEGVYKVRINGTTYDAIMAPNTAGVLRLNIVTIGNYAVYPEGLTKFQVRNFEPDNIDFYFVESRQWNESTLQVFRPKDDARFVIAKIQ